MIHRLRKDWLERLAKSEVHEFCCYCKRPIDLERDIYLIGHIRDYDYDCTDGDDYDWSDIYFTCQSCAEYQDPEIFDKTDPLEEISKALQEICNILGG